MYTFNGQKIPVPNEVNPTYKQIETIGPEISRWDQGKKA